MVEKEFVTVFSEICRSIEESRGMVNLFAIVKMDELTDKWTVIISAQWVNDDTFEGLFSELRKLMLDKLGDAIYTVARISIFDLSNHLSELMIQRFESGDSIKTDEQINGNLIHEGYIIKVAKLTEPAT